ncbi:PRC-barrel domain-containing protein [Streptomyces flavotricini]|uniref:PRC-barrel domain-containing protein n=1 Tax=Streptomyces flavotricini TaxID=66888 RepID=A0ABS8DY70_9ACTN|nr:PRC-barrel domain-containing protein [Streptomyces flavotricini]
MIGKVDEATEEVGSSYIVVDTGPWIFGKEVLLPAGTVVRVDVKEKEIQVNLTKDQIKDSPEYDKESTAAMSRTATSSASTTGAATSKPRCRAAAVPTRQGSRSPAPDWSPAHWAAREPRGWLTERAVRELENARDMNLTDPDFVESGVAPAPGYGTRPLRS